MNWPAKEETLNRAGWAFTGRSHCKSCGRKMRWAKGPNGKTMPLEVASGFYQPHFASCPAAADHRQRQAAIVGQGRLF